MRLDGKQRVVLRAGRVITCDERVASADNPLGALEAVSMLIEDGRIVAIGADAASAGRDGQAIVLEHPDALVTPGLVDAHTHAAWVGSRAHEYVLRMRGAGYEDIARAGGGIVASMRAVRAASVETIARALTARLRRMATLGVTTVEVKSGYGLSEPAERRLLEAIAVASHSADHPAVVPTFLGLHAVPPEYEGDRDRYASDCCGWLERFAADGLARFVDAYVDRNAFSVDQARPLLARARELGLGVRLHAGQFADIGGAELAASLGASSADHLEQLGEPGAAALGAAGTRAVLLPVASFTLGQAPPPIERLRQANVPIVVASDANPGTAPTESLPLAMSLAVRNYGLSVVEAWLGATRQAAASLSLRAGVLCPGAPADLVVWDLPHEDDVVQPWGCARTRLVLRAGRTIAAVE